MFDIYYFVLICYFYVWYLLFCLDLLFLCLKIFLKNLSIKKENCLYGHEWDKIYFCY